MNGEVLLEGEVTHFDGTANLGAVVRWTDATHWDKVFIDGTRLVLLQRNGGDVNTILASVPFTAASGIRYSLRLRAVGTTLQANVWRSDTLEPPAFLLTAPDKILKTGHVGVRVVLSPQTIMRIALFTATSAASSTR